MMELTENERQNLLLLDRHRIPFGYLRPTAVALSKSIIDATDSFRSFLSENAIHNFGYQGRGSENRALIPATIISNEGIAAPSVVSLYVTNRGDPRTWAKGLLTISSPGDLIVFCWNKDGLRIINASVLCFESSLTPTLFADHEAAPQPSNDSSIAEELLEKLNAIAQKGFIQAPVEGPTSVGRLLESELGIQMNSSRAPDYHGIEIKAARSSSRRATMFAQVPDWKRSSYSSSKLLLNAFGAEGADGRTLSCSISARKPNRQDLYLQVDRDAQLLRVRQDELSPHEVVLWDLTLLKKRLAQKHGESVWVEADVQKIANREYFHFRTVRHTREGRPDELVRLLQSGVVTVDFLISEHGDKGYLFKIALDQVQSLFVHSRAYRFA